MSKLYGSAVTMECALFQLRTWCSLGEVDADVLQCLRVRSGNYIETILYGEVDGQLGRGAAWILDLCFLWLLR